MTVFAISKTYRSKPTAYFNTLSMAQRYNEKWHKGKFVIVECMVFVDVS